MHVRHFKKGQVYGLDNHNRRVFKNHSNKEIDKSRSSQNITLREPGDGKSLYQACNEIIAEDVIAKGGRVTRASVWITEICFHLPSDLRHTDAEKYFESIVQYFEEHGKGKVMSAYIHLDEENEHMHLDICDILGNRLTCRDIWTRAYLYRLHDELPLFLRSKGFSVERGTETKTTDEKIKASMTMNEYKAYKDAEKSAKEEINKLTEQYNRLADDYNDALHVRNQLKKGNKQIARELIQNRERGR